MSKIVVIGIDSMDRRLVSEYIDDMPNFKKISEQTPNFNLKSVFPPDSDTAWASIYTGLNPAKHGIVNFVDPLEKASIYQTDYLDVSSIKGRTFWDIASKNGKRVCLIFPHIAYPVWEVNGFMISPVPKTDDFQIYPPDFKFNFKIDKLEVPRRIPNSKSEYKEYLKRFENIVKNEFDFGQKMLLNYEWDFFFFYSCVLDYIQHIFWNYCDPNDPTYPGDDNPFKDAIKKFYLLHDDLIGKMLAKIDNNDPIIIMSDHGHSMRPINLFNMNEALRREGYLATKKSMMNPIWSLNEELKRKAVDLIQKSDLRKIALNILRRYPKVKEIYTVPPSIDFNKTVAHCTDLSGMKSYTYGGIIISKNIDKNKKSKTKNEIIEKLSKYTDIINNPIFEWIIERENLYYGDYLDKYPDILFKLKENYGAGWAINVPLFTKTTAHNFFPGSHYGDTPIFYVLNNDRKPLKIDLELTDIAPTILSLLNININELDFDGKSIY